VDDQCRRRRSDAFDAPSARADGDGGPSRPRHGTVRVFDAGGNKTSRFKRFGRCLVKI
jgi:hypothetical protein